MEQMREVDATYRSLGRRAVWDAVSFASFQGWESTIRRRAVARLQLQPGDRVLDVACGRGSNLPYLRRVVGERGQIVGIDYSETMLAGAQQLVRRNGWTNVDLVKGDAADMQFRKEFDGALTVLSLTVIPRWQDALQQMAGAVRPGRRIVAVEASWGSGWRRVWNPWLRLLSRVTAGDLGRDIPAEFRRSLMSVQKEAVSLSTAYILTGTVPQPS
ncbi:MAG: methyltransferase domain-containing protein [Chloroflexi bacterium]|nr:methyltransferase domain-containing protein [Chloroflexota bacterium]